MSRKERKEYSSIQIAKDLNKHIRQICKENGWVASTMTENYWMGLISSSVSSSVYP